MQNTNEQPKHITRPDDSTTGLPTVQAAGTNLQGQQLMQTVAIQPGLTKREYFAAISMYGLCGVHEPKKAAKEAVQYADALINELNKSNENATNLLH